MPLSLRQVSIMPEEANGCAIFTKGTPFSRVAKADGIQSSTTSAPPPAMTWGGADGVTVLKQGFNVDPILQKQADCVSTMTYNEYWQIIDAGLSPDDLVVFKYEDEGVSTLEDGIYVLEESLEDPEMVDKLARFVKASMKGWKWAEENPEEAALIVLDNDASGAQTEKHQTRMMGEIAKLTAGSDGTLDVAAAERTVATLLAGGSDPVISKAPEGAWTSKITDMLK